VKYLLVIFLIFGLHSVEAQTKRAFIIGIGAYPVESGWCTIHGDNDVPLIEDALILRGFNPDKIAKLVNEQATKTNIIKCFNQLIKQAKINDIIYIHFSTHGQQVIDIDGDEADGLDEAVIPFDACKTFVKGQYEGKNHLIDDELYSYLTSLRGKIGKLGSLVVVIDACHSGDATRGERSENDSIVVRGTSEVFQAGHKSSFVAKHLKLVDWVVISATQPYQNNFEYKVNGSYYGSLSYAIKLSLPDLTNEDDFAALFKIIQKRRTEMNVVNYPQRPMIQGDSYYLKQKVF
jgi:Caspase domain